MREENLILNWSHLLITVVVVVTELAVVFVFVALVDAAAVGIVSFVLQALQSAASDDDTPPAEMTASGEQPGTGLEMLLARKSIPIHKFNYIYSVLHLLRYRTG
jgi:hypothetical protein